jgi:hypothetical protein
MSFIATDYVKQLAKTPEGAWIKGTSWALLWFLASAHNEKAGGAWPSTKEIARHCGITERYCRARIAEMERTGIIQRAFTRNSNTGGQSSNLYIFVALAGKTAQRFDDLNQVVRVPRLPMSLKPRTPQPPAPDQNIRPGQPSTAGSPGDAVPPIESLGEIAREDHMKSLADTPVARPRLQSSVPPVAHLVHAQKQTFPKKATASCYDVNLGKTALNHAVESLYKTLFGSAASSVNPHSGFVSGTKDWNSFRLDRLTVLSLEPRGPSTVLMTVTSPAPKSTKRGLKLHQKYLEQSLSQFYGCAVQLNLDTGR